MRLLSRRLGRPVHFAGLWVSVVLLAAGLSWLLDRHHRSTVSDLLAQHERAQWHSWEAVLARQGSIVEAYFERYVQRPETLRWLVLAQNPARRDEARAGLEREFAEFYATLQGLNIQLFHFHLPDGASLLRFHQLEHHGDELGDFRQSLRLVGQEDRPVQGFELGRSGLAYRHVLPIRSAEGVRLGSVEFGMLSAELVAGLASLAPEREIEVLIKSSPNPGQDPELPPGQYRPWSASAALIAQQRVDAANPQSGLRQQLHAAVAADAELRGAFESVSAGVDRLPVAGVDYALVRTTLLDPAGRAIGLLVSYAPEPALLRLDQAHGISLALALLGCLLLGGISHYLLLAVAAELGERRRLRLITRSLGQGLYVLDAGGVITEVNPRVTALLGYHSSELIGRKAHELFHQPQHEKEVAERGCVILNAIAHGQRYQGEQQFRCKDGRKLDVMVISVPIEDMGGSVTLFDDITRQKDNERKLHHFAHFDALTGLPNRVLLADRLAQAMASARRSGNRLALAFIDLDGFKAVNDTHGHETGDRLLVRLSRRIQSILRETDTVARLGGDEFAVVMPDAGDQFTTGALLDRLLQAAAHMEMIDGSALQVSASIGVSLYPQEEDIDADQLLRQADQAMYEAKLAGKNRYRVFDVARDTDLRGRHEHFDRLYRAIQAEELKLYFQPKVNMRTGEAIGAEALIRWQHPRRGLLPPSAFLPLINRHALEVDIGRWVLRTALQQMDRWRREGIQLEVSINIAGEHLQHPAFLAELRAALARCPEVPAHLLQLEVVESSALEDITAVSHVIEGCANLGVSVALDDFGTGYSSLTYLKRLPIRTIKLDQSFVRDMVHDPDDLAILDGVLNLARAFGLESIAEGVESPDHGRMLLQLGCEAAQGFAIARPMPASGMRSWMDQWRLPQAWKGARDLHGPARDALYARVGYRHWLRLVKAFLDGSTQAAPAPDARLSLLYRRLKRSKAAAQQGSTEHRLVVLHEELHTLGDRLLKTKIEHGTYSALVEFSQLEGRSAELIGALDRLVEA